MRRAVDENLAEQYCTLEKGIKNIITCFIIKDIQI